MVKNCEAIKLDHVLFIHGIEQCLLCLVICGVLSPLTKFLRGWSTLCNSSQVLDMAVAIHRLYVVIEGMLCSDLCSLQTF